MMENTPKREVVCRDALEWLKEQSKIQGSVITSLPDVSEVPMSLIDWKKWFVGSVHEILLRLDENECAIFYQTDVKIIKEGKFIEWIDKSYLVNRGSEGVPECTLVWHKIMSFNTDITKPSVTKKKAGYSHMLCFRKNAKNHDENLPDVISRGKMVWTKGMGFNACCLAVKYAKKIGSKCVVDPFCGKGSILAVANYMGLDSFGVEISSTKCRNAMNLRISEDGNNFSWGGESSQGGKGEDTNETTKDQPESNTIVEEEEGIVDKQKLSL